MFSFLALTVLGLASLSYATVNISIPQTAPSTAKNVSPRLIGFSLEGDRWPDWSGRTIANTFTLNVLGNLRDLTGTPPDLRVGADSEDNTNFNPAVDIDQTNFVAPTASNPYPEATNVTVGDGYYALSRFMPKGTRMTWGVNFGTNNLTAGLLEAQSVMRAFAPNSAAVKAGVILDRIQFGNEPDFYKNNGKRPSNWTTEDYVANWSAFASNITETIGLKKGSLPSVFGLAFGASSHGLGDFSPAQAFEDGVLSSPAGQLIQDISQHKYSGGCCTGVIQDLMNKASVRGNLSAYVPDIRAVNSRGLNFIFGETNSYFNHGIPNVSDAGGAAIWIADYSLFAASLGVKSIYYHEGIGYKYNLIQPVALNISTEDGTPLSQPLPPHVQAPYYGAIVVNEFLGKNSVRNVTELQISSPIISAYALHTANGLTRVLLINSRPFLRSSVNRPVESIQLSGFRSGTTLSIKRLSIPHADDQTGLKWGGQSFETQSGKPSGSVQTETVDASKPIIIAATEIMLLSVL